uniref:Uncharacterized protein n=1 Tax=Lepeophtheirus salmonis TaxID=72036 RepID=A0A0K2THW6_LEPSM
MHTYRRRYKCHSFHSSLKELFLQDIRRPISRGYSYPLDLSNNSRLSIISISRSKRIQY